MDKIIVYSTGCPLCRALEKILKDKNIEFEISNNIDEIRDKGFRSLPIVKKGNNFLTYPEMIKELNK